ncbi:MAG: ABC-F family ATP-binding cassette domain-containing protein [Bacteroidetes bacterium]|nr:ABC-F family ATP-binding cassette domain-containing protein [Bacteroidota bacterium]MCW5894680.1 ABC-F family ATP-binding cassette domain-containing protein [Bacteroidota bacterium]
MISAVNIALQYGSKILFKGVSFRIGTHDRIGLVGSNGTGKTTLLRMLIGEASPDKGEIAKAKYVTVGYLPQEGMHVEGRTLYKEAETAFGDVLEAQQHLEEVHRRMGEVTDHQSEEFQELLELYGELQHKLEDSDAFRMKAKIEKVLLGLGFSVEDLDRQTDEFSGGWQMRIALAKLLLIQPSLLLLDEPTNHLDLDSLQWLEEYLQSYEGAVMIVSHDRRFLDNMTTKTYELSLGNLAEYPGNFSLYVREKEERKQLTLAAYQNQQQQIKQTERFIERFRYKATKARQVQSRVKMLEKMDLVEIEDEESGIHFKFPPAPSSGRSVLEIRNLQKSYGSKRIFSGIDFDIDRGDRIAFVGVNGAGKSTLSKIVAGVEPFEGGERKLGHNVILSYFAQHQADELNPANDVLGTVDEVAVGEIRKSLRNLLGCFLFRGDDVFKKVAVLSGGEKSRLALAKMLLQPCNLIVMDEPTNHLDMRSKAVMQKALMNFEGSYIIVSHDRDFLDPIVNKVVEFSKGGVRTFAGNVSEYIYAKQKEIAASTATVSVPARKEESHISEKERRRIEAEQRQRAYKITKPLKEKITKAEREIEQKEALKREIEELMGHPDFYKDGGKVKAVTAQYKNLESELQNVYFRWGELTRELERVTGEMND